MENTIPPLPKTRPKGPIFPARSHRHEPGEMEIVALVDNRFDYETVKRRFHALNESVLPK